MNDKLQWNNVADKYEDEIFSVFKNDKGKKIEHYLKKHADKNHVAIDFGCGIGYALPLITPYFKKVIALDVSQECINKAQLVSYENVVFKQADPASTKIDPVKGDFAFVVTLLSQEQYKKLSHSSKCIEFIKSWRYCSFCITFIRVIIAFITKND